MKPTRALLLTSLVALAPVIAPAEELLTTGEYKEICGRSDDLSLAYCLGFIQASMDIAQRTNRACIPDGTRSEDVHGPIEALTFDKIGTPGFPETQAAIMMAIAIISQLHPCSGD